LNAAPADTTTLLGFFPFAAFILRFQGGAAFRSLRARMPFMNIHLDLFFEGLAAVSLKAQLCLVDQSRILSRLPGFALPQAGCADPGFDRAAAAALGFPVSGLTDVRSDAPSGQEIRFGRQPLRASRQGPPSAPGFCDERVDFSRLCSSRELAPDRRPFSVLNS